MTWQNWVWAVCIGLFIVIAPVIEYGRFRAVKRYYPELSYYDYCFLRDRLRIVPDGR